MIIQLKFYSKILLERIRGIDILWGDTIEGAGLTKDRANHYSSSGNKYFRRILDQLGINSSDKIIDFGSGKGGALVTMTKYPFAEIAGVELSEKLDKIARKNMRILKLKASLYCIDASQHTDIDRFNYFYFSNPFPSAVMQKVAANIQESMNRNKRHITIIYKNPVCHNDIITLINVKKIMDLDSDHDHRVYIYKNELS